jgi:inhibitor of KinA sporulation pathway (predicted exonuclease)
MSKRLDVRNLRNLRPYELTQVLDAYEQEFTEAKDRAIDQRGRKSANRLLRRVEQLRVELFQDDGPSPTL